MSEITVQDIEEWREKAESGDFDAAYKLARVLDIVEGREQYEIEINKWLRMAAESGHVDAMRDLFIDLLFSSKDCQGRVTGWDKGGEITKWARKAADKGDSKSQFFLGYLLSRETHDEFDPEEALKWAIKSALQGNPDSFEDEESIPKILSLLQKRADNHMSERLNECRKLASEGNAEAQFELAGILQNGDCGVEVDGVVAEDLYQQAAEQGHFEAQLEILQRKANE